MARKRIVIMTAAVALTLAVASARAAERRDAGQVPADAAGWYGAASLYRAVALWAGKRALLAESKYWEAVS